MTQVPYDEFGLFHENAAEFGLPYDGPPTVRRVEVQVGPGRRLSALVWGEGPPELVLLHGGAQNAHTWDTVAMALGRPLVAIDLPGHGHSDGPAESSAALASNAADVATVIEALAPDALGVVGMSLGGMTTMALVDARPDLVRAVVLVDVTPGVNQEKAAAIVAFVDGPESFPDFDELLERTMQFNPTRSESSLRRGILHNAVQRPDGSWVWRYRRFIDRTEPLEIGSLWEAVGRIKVPVMLVRGMRPQSVVDDADEAELLRRLPSARVEHVEEAGHSVQGDDPLTLARLLDEFLPPAVTLLGLAHVAVCVPDVDAAVAWYESVLGLQVLSPPYLMEGDAIARDMGELVPAPVALKAAIVGVDGSDHVIEVIEYPNARGEVGGGPADVTRVGLTHVGLICDDIDATRARLEAQGVELLTTGIAEVARVRTTWFRDPWGVVFILVEKTKADRPYWRQH